MDIAVLKFFESIRTGALTALFSFFTFFGEENFIVLAVMTVYYALNKKIGEYLAFSVFTSAALNGIIKDSVCRARPYIAGHTTKVKLGNFISTDLANSYSFPSGHAQISASFFTAAAFIFKKKYLKFLCAAAVVCVMLSRLYLGVHYPTDVIAGAALGFFCAVVWHIIYKNFYSKRAFIFIFLFAALSISLIFVRSEDTFKALGAGLGAAAGILLENRLVNFNCDASVYKRTLRVVIGLIAVLLVRYGLKALLPDILILSFVRYFIILIFMTFIFPAVFKKLGF